MVMITVGKPPNPQQIYTIHKEVICNASPFFEKALKEKCLFVDNKTLEIKIDFTNPTIFGLFQKWVYYSKITDANNKLPAVSQIVSLWILADRLQAPALQNLTIQALFGKMFCDVPQGFKLLYQNTGPGSPLRRLFIDSVVVRKMPRVSFSKILEDHWDEIPQEMMKEVLLAQKDALHEAGLAISGSPRRLLKREDYLVPVPEQTEQ
jgi:hypothetical protein